jgi:OOP family OmpA-OmpF porin
MRSIALSMAAAGLMMAGSASAQDTPAPADSAAPLPPAADSAPAAAPADAGVPPPVLPAEAPPDASAPPAPVASSDPLEGIRDVDYVAGLVNGDRPDTRRSFNGNDVHYGTGASIIFGRHFGNGFGWEANYTYSDLETGPHGGGDYYLHNLGGDLTYSLGDRQHLTPFVLIGGGGTFDDVNPRSRNGGSGYVDAGLGLTTGTFWHNRIRLRGEVRASHDFISTGDQHGYTDYRAGLGIEIPFYEVKPLPPAAAPEAPVVVVKVEKTGLEDSDGDGVVDSKDKCPDTPPHTRVDGDGCPIPKVLRLDGVTFEFNKAKLRPDAQTILNYVVSIMQKYQDMQVELAGYTDSIGKDSYNLKLSQKRAESVKAFLIDKGIDGARIQAKGYGKANPVASNDTADGREYNRRVELHVLN